MLFQSLILAAVGVIVAGLLFEQLRNGGAHVKVAVPLVAAVVGEFVATVMLAFHLILLCPVLLVVGYVCLGAKARTATFVTWSVGVTLLLTLGIGWLNQRQWAEVRRQYPLESLAERLAYETNRGARAITPPDAPVDEAKRPEDAIQADAFAEDFYARMRTASLAYAHASQVEQFIDSQGFGVGRMVARPAPYYATRGEFHRADENLEVRGESPPPSESEPKAQALAPMAQHEQEALKLLPLHRESLVDFANPNGFGWVKDLRHVAGFRPHRFSRLPEFMHASRTVKERWRTARVELVSLLKHEQPMAYVSSRLPKMDELRDAAVRPLDAFEQDGLSQLRRGDELVVRAAVNRIQMLGPLPALRQCLECHQVRRGELLGAFSYEFLRDPPIALDNAPDGALPAEL